MAARFAWQMGSCQQRNVGGSYCGYADTPCYQRPGDCAQASRDATSALACSSPVACGECLAADPQCAWWPSSSHCWSRVGYWGPAEDIVTDGAACPVTWLPLLAFDPEASPAVIAGCACAAAVFGAAVVWELVLAKRLGSFGNGLEAKTSTGPGISEAGAPSSALPGTGDRAHVKTTSV